VHDHDAMDLSSRVLQCVDHFLDGLGHGKGVQALSGRVLMVIVRNAVLDVVQNVL